MKKRVEVYRNLHKQNFTVRSAGRENRGRKIGSGSLIVIDNADFVVQPGGRKRAVETGQRNVHAFIRGEWNESVCPYFADWFECHMHYAEEVTYNPFNNDSFVMKRRPNIEAHSHWRVILFNNRAYIMGREWWVPMSLNGVG